MTTSTRRDDNGEEEEEEEETAAAEDAVSDDGFVYAEVEVCSVDEGTDSEEEEEEKNDDDDDDVKAARLLSEEEEEEELTLSTTKSTTKREEEEEEKEAEEDAQVESSRKELREDDRRRATTAVLRDDDEEEEDKEEEEEEEEEEEDNALTFVEKTREKMQRHHEQFTTLATATKTNQDALLLCERLKREIQTHKTHRFRLEQEKREQMKTIKRLKKEAEDVFAPAIEDLNAKYGACMKDRTMLTIERDKLVKKVKELEKELNEMKEAQKKRKEEENEKKRKAKTITTTNGGSVASKIATRVKATEHGMAKEDAPSTPSSSASLLKKFKQRKKKYTKSCIVVAQEAEENTRRAEFDQTARAEKAAVLEERVVEATKEEMNTERKYEKLLKSWKERRHKTVNVTHARLISLPKSDEDQRFASALHPSKKCMAYGDESGGWKMLDTNTGELVASFESTAPTHATSASKFTFLSFSNTGKILLCGDARGCVSLFNLVLAKRVLFFPYSPLATPKTNDGAESPKLDSTSTYCLFVNDGNNNNNNNKSTKKPTRTSATTPLEVANPGVKSIALSPSETFVAITYKNSNIFKIFECCYSPPKETEEGKDDKSFLVCEIKSECSPDISSVYFINDTTVIIRDETSAAYRVSF